MSGVDLSTSEHDGLAVAALRGELDVTGAAAVAAELRVVASGGRVVIADLAGLEFIDSTGLGALVHVLRHARQGGGDLLLAAPQRRVLRSLAITQLTDVFSVHASVAEAAASTQAPQETAPRRLSPAPPGGYDPRAAPAFGQPGAPIIPAAGNGSRHPAPNRVRSSESRPFRARQGR